MFNFFSEIKNKFKETMSKTSPYQIVTMGDFLMYVEGAINLMTLSKENIVFKVNGGVIVVSGENLSLKEITTNTLSIVGKIYRWEKIW